MHASVSVGLEDINRARQRIAEMVYRTPTIRSRTLGELSNSLVHLKLENLQVTGSFKARGAANKISSLSDTERAAGVIAVSTGNHGRAVAHVAKHFGIQAVVCLTTGVPANKLRAIERLGAEIDATSESQDQAFERAAVLQRERKLTYVPPFDDLAIIAGQGTIGLELLDDLPDLGTAVVPLSGGGLIGGVALALKTINPAIRVIGVSMERGAAMAESLKAAKPVEVPEQDSLADSLQGGIGADNRWTLELVQKYVDEVLLVSEEEIAQAMSFALEEHRLVLEGAAVVGVAALMHSHVKPSGAPVAVVLTGGNVDLEQLFELWRERRVRQR
ncbi:MAG: hydroxyectoine utilization dehydratase EutB [Candidatus Methylomirabilales bacterium]